MATPLNRPRVVLVFVVVLHNVMLTLTHRLTMSPPMRPRLMIRRPLLMRTLQLSLKKRRLFLTLQHPPPHGPNLA